VLLAKKISQGFDFDHCVAMGNGDVRVSVTVIFRVLEREPFSDSNIVDSFKLNTIFGHGNLSIFHVILLERFIKGGARPHKCAFGLRSFSCPAVCMC